MPAPCAENPGICADRLLPDSFSCWSPSHEDTTTDLTGPPSLRDTPGRFGGIRAAGGTGEKIGKDAAEAGFQGQACLDAGRGHGPATALSQGCLSSICGSPTGPTREPSES